LWKGVSWSQYSTLWQEVYVTVYISKRLLWFCLVSMTLTIRILRKCMWTLRSKGLCDPHYLLYIVSLFGLEERKRRLWLKISYWKVHVYGSLSVVEIGRSQRSFYKRVNLSSTCRHIALYNIGRSTVNDYPRHKNSVTNYKRNRISVHILRVFWEHLTRTLEADSISTVGWRMNSFSELKTKNLNDVNKLLSFQHFNLGIPRGVQFLDMYIHMHSCFSNGILYWYNWFLFH
jgi:hypothetical protein